MFKKIEGLIKEYHRRRILKDIKKAKTVYEMGMTDFMCHAFMYVRTKYCNKPIYKFIPEFNKDFLNAQYKQEYKSVWWDSSDRESRIKAFDKLIEVYSKK